MCVVFAVCMCVCVHPCMVRVSCVVCDVFVACVLRVYRLFCVCYVCVCVCVRCVCVFALRVLRMCVVCRVCVCAYCA